MVRCRVDMAYFPFFFFGADFFAAAVFFAAVFFGADLRLRGGRLRRGLGFAVAFAFFAGFASAFGLRRLRVACGAGSFSAIGVSVWPMAVASISTTSDQSRWYVDTSEYGITSHVRQVAAAEVHVRLRAVRQDQHLLSVDAQPLQQRRAAPSSSAPRSRSGR